MRLTTGEAMRQARESYGISQERLSKAAGLGRNAVNTYETDSSVPSIYAVIALADVLGISIDEYVGHTIKNNNARGGEPGWMP